MRGETVSYLRARLARSRPDLLERLERGEFRSVRAAAIEAGFVKPRAVVSIPLDREKAAKAASGNPYHRGTGFRCVSNGRFCYYLGLAAELAVLKRLETA